MTPQLRRRCQAITGPAVVLRPSRKPTAERLSSPEKPDMLDMLDTLTEYAGHRGVIAIRQAGFK